MYRNKLVLTLLTWTMLLVACNDSDETTEMTETYPVELSISFPEKDQTFQYQGWNGNREIAALRTDTRYANKLILSHSGEDTYIAESEKEITQYTKFAFLYPASASTVATSDTLTQTLYIDRQNGTLDGLIDFDYFWGTYAYNSDKEDDSSTCVLNSLMNLCKFRFTYNGQPVEQISQVIITSPTDSLHVVGKLNLADGSITSQKRGSIVLRNTQGLAGEIYAALFPTKTALHFTVSTLDGKSYEASLPETMEFKTGSTFVHTEVTCSALQPARIGDYYYNDATWSTSPDKSKTCVGIVFALDNKDGNIDKNLTESAHGRVVALEDAEKKTTWGITNVDIEDLENYTFLQDTMYIGSLPYQDGTTNGFFLKDVKEQLAGVQVNSSTGQISSWYPQGALSDFKGQENTLHILENADTYYAPMYCHDYGRGLYGWYLPSAGELALLWTLHRIGIIDNETYGMFKDLEMFGYWTSTEYDSGNAWYINFASGIITKNSKLSTYYSRPAIRF